MAFHGSQINLRPFRLGGLYGPNESVHSRRMIECIEGGLMDLAGIHRDDVLLDWLYIDNATDIIAKVEEFLKKIQLTFLPPIRLCP